MHFKNPELLYALFLLIIPIIVHLFRLRKFQKEDFTNVKFLKKVIQETRKSSQLKKFLVLFTRLLLYTSLILAFAQPYIPASQTALKETRNLFYLDNSFSMQAPEGSGTLLQNIINQLIGNEINEDFTFLTNDSEGLLSSGSSVKNELLDIDFSSKTPDFRNLQVRAQNYFRNYPSSKNRFIIISDFQENLEIPNDFDDLGYEINLIPKRAQNFINISLDTAYIQSSNPETLNLNIQLSSNREVSEPVVVSVLNGEELLGRNSVDLEDNYGEISFTLQNRKVENGRIEIEDSGLKYDNRLFFNIRENQPKQVVIISEQNEDFLNRIFTEPEFEISRFKPAQIDFNKLNSANLIIVNEPSTVPNSLITNLENTRLNGASLIIIPSASGGNYNGLIQRLGFSELSKRIQEERLITSIEFDHPLLVDVFEDRTENFEYPKTLTSFNITGGTPILNYQDNQPFLLENNSVFVFTAPINSENSNFTNSPLVVPIFYQIGLKSLKNNQLYYLTNTSSKIDIPVQLSKDEVLHLETAESDLIPLQQNFGNRIEISIDNIDLNAGNFAVKASKTDVSTISFNYARTESKLAYTEISNLQDLNLYKTINEFFEKVNASSQINALWKWFVIFALIFLVIEMLLLKFLK